MASMLTCVVTGATWCFCTAAASLLSSCCGNDKPSTVTPGSRSGRKRSVLLLILAIAIAFAFQYGVAPYIVTISISNYVTNAWLSGCDDYDNEAFIQNCAGQAGVYRSSLAAFIFFVLAGIAVTCKQTANREAWPAKYVLFLFLVAGFCVSIILLYISVVERVLCREQPQSKKPIYSHLYFFVFCRSYIILSFTVRSQ